MKVTGYDAKMAEGLRMLTRPFNPQDTVSPTVSNMDYSMDIILLEK